MNPVTIVWMIADAMFNCVRAVRKPKMAIAHYVTVPRNGPECSFALITDAVTSRRMKCASTNAASMMSTAAITFGR